MNLSGLSGDMNLKDVSGYSPDSVLLLVYQNIENQISNKLHPRFKITSFDVCESYIVVGCNSGILYFLRWDDWAILYQVLTQNGRIVQISICPDEAYLAYASGNGYVHIMKVPGQIPSTRLHPVSSKEHEGAIVTALVWSQTGQDLYVGDSDGRLSLLHVPSNVASSFLLNLAHSLMMLDSAICQLDFKDGFLLVSTLAKTFICNTRLETYSQMGTRGRQGEYGACFCPITSHRGLFSDFIDESLEESGRSIPTGQGEVEKAADALSVVLEPCEENTPVGKELLPQGTSFPKVKLRAFCSRPGQRLWESDLEGKVLATHQLRKAVSIPPAPLLTASASVNTPGDLNLCGDLPSHSGAFRKVLRFYDEYLITFSSSSAYVVDPETSKVLLWTPIPGGISDLRVVGGNIVVLTQNLSLLKVQVSTADVAVLTLHAKEAYSKCASVCLRYEQVLLKSPLWKKFWKGVMNDLLHRLTDESLMQELKLLKDKMASVYTKPNSTPETAPSSPSSFSDQEEKEFPKVPRRTSSSSSSSISSSPFSSSHSSLFSSSPSLDSFPGDVSKRLKDRSNRRKDRMTQGSMEEGKQDPLNDLVGGLVSSLSMRTKIFAESLKESLVKASSPVDVGGFFYSQRLNVNIMNGEEVQYPLQEPRLLRSYSPVLETRSLKKKLKGSHRRCTKYLATSGKESRVPLPDFLLEYGKETSKMMERFFLKGADKGVLKEWLMEYLRVLEDVQKEKRGTDWHSDRDASEQCYPIVRDSSVLFLTCLKLRVVASGEEHSKVIDEFYADLINRDEGLLDPRFLLSGFEEVEYLLPFRVWCSLMKKVVSSSQTPPSVLPDVDFARSQRIQYLKGYLESHGVEEFAKAAASFKNASLFFDVYCLLRHQFDTSPDVLGGLNSYLIHLASSPEVGDLYMKEWSSNPQLQFEIISALLHKQSRVEPTCSCSFPFSSPCEFSPSMALLSGIISRPLYHPERVYELLERKLFYSGMFSLVLRYQLRPLLDVAPKILQSLHTPSVMSLIHRLQPAQFLSVLQAASKILGHDESSVRCFNCSSQLPQLHVAAETRNPFKDSLAERRPPVTPGGIRRKEEKRLWSYFSLWDLIYSSLLCRIGSVNCLQLLFDLGDALPRPTLLKRLLAKTIICCLVERRGAWLRWTLAQFWTTPRLYLSYEVRLAMDKAVELKEDKDETEIPEDSVHSNENLESVPEQAPPTTTLERRRESGTRPSTNQLQPRPKFSPNQNGPPPGGHHWGVRVQLLNGVCHLCQLGLTEDVMVNAGGITIFSCGHAYHTVCLTHYGRICVICHHNSTSSNVAT